ncbi:major facilitator superfamily domain-containing protein [Amylocarpus encephaloides]|uniref:Major facilitator superfamily domain-containing protein n=1 Tax=Amylocarpus encephaloides TaxID=45428 RepID=A0A9P7YD88_9HELO|nr:major facilitator superfamily domain-containing protein [Amylocarpus encephaloides]
MDGTVTSTALPTIVDNLGTEGLYVWFVNALFLSSTCALPLYGKLANIFGWRWVTIAAVAIFTLGSGICGGARNSAMMIAGRTIQGLGVGGTLVMIDIIVSDLLPLRLRQKYMGIVFAVFMVGTTIGPFVGGIIVQNTTWRWIFWINLPVGEYDRETKLWGKITRIDFLGNVVLMASSASTSFRVLLPLLFGFAGTAGFHFLQASKWVVEPTMPGHLFTSRTTVSGYLQAFTNSMLMSWSIYFLPVYFQAVLSSTPARSGIQFLPSVITGVPFAIVGYQIIQAIGSGMLMSAVLPGLQAELPESDMAAITATYQFIRCYGAIWGFAVPAAIFNSQFTNLAGKISDEKVRNLLRGGAAYSYVSRDFINSFGPIVRGEIIKVDQDALKLIWQVALGISIFSFLIMFMEREIKLRTVLETEFGLKKGEKSKT